MHRTYIADVERGARNVTLRSIVNLAAALEVTVGHLLSCATAPAGASLGAGRADGDPAPTEILLVEDSAADAALTMRAFKRPGSPTRCGSSATPRKGWRTCSATAGTPSGGRNVPG